MSARGEMLVGQSCSPCTAGTPPLPVSEIETLRAQLAQWQVVDGRLCRDFTFQDHHAVMAFVNAVAWISHQQDHHPDMHIGYNTCHVTYLTHAIQGLSRNDFICAAKIDALFER